MSDFDKEAEREKLREKYEHDKQKREATEQMSELLLQGATMTNAHCSDCSDPIFRYDGQEFCPTCEKAVDRATGDDEADADGDQGTGSIEVTEPGDTRVQFGGSAGDEATTPTRSQTGGGQQESAQPAGEASSRQSTGETSQRQPADGTPDPQSAGQTPDPQSVGKAPDPQSAGGAPGQPAAGEQSPGPRTRERDSGTTETRRGQETRATGGAGLADARESLVRTIVRFSDRAEAADDPRRAEDNLAAVREAAEALSALDS